ncbi:hypothetical protein BgAZ_502520 [Babesia gibsoni]|uniref:Uncharacterized protein n=1 Tax=Babesia gibsoni TaxID=33632 RepID=A0AAD8LG09_BABGI|nr:hypothetical protein BgAZ_502520 [Babesia gibsoni]
MQMSEWKPVSLDVDCSRKSNGSFSHVKIASFSPDGSSFITVLDDHCIAVYDTCHQLEGDSASHPDGLSTSHDAPLPAPAVIDGYDDVRSICFFPNYSASDPDSCCFLVAGRGTPIHLYDIRCGSHHFTYKPIDSHEELADVYSLDFHPLGKYFLAGGKGSVYVFDIESPGRGIEMRRLYTNRKSGQCGIISAITHNPYSSNVYACGDYNSNICVYDHNVSRYNSQFGPFRDNLLPIGPITQLRWIKDSMLLVGSRNDLYIRLFDIRSTCEEPLLRLRRPAKTNQRIEFDIRNDEIISGTSDGGIVMYSVSSEETKFEQKIAPVTVSSSKFHPTLPVLLTASGTRNYWSEPDEELSSAEVKLWRTSQSEDT